MKAALALASLLASCTGHHVPILQEHPHVVFASPGELLRLVFDAPIDGQPVGTTWTGEDLAGSPLSYMERPAVIFKADDFGGPLSDDDARFLEALDARGQVAALGIITHLVENDALVNETYRMLHARGFELWFHGHTHDWSLPEAEFAGVGVAAQIRSFERGLRRGRERLGVTFRSFGAPGNAIDDDTAVALERFPEIRVWIFGPPTGKALALTRELNVETKVGRLQEIGGFLQVLDGRLASFGRDTVQTLQVHPRLWTILDHLRFEALLDALVRRKLRTTTPDGWWRWRHDRPRLRITKTGPREYVLDLRRAAHAHRLSFDPDGPLPVLVERALGPAQEATP